jgi:FKBP-type peptidyl-prolyl cis-trans isomerase
MRCHFYSLKLLFYSVCVLISISGCNSTAEHEDLGEGIFKKWDAIGDCSPSMKAAEHFILDLRIAAAKDLAPPRPKNVKAFTIHYHNLNDSILMPWEDSLHWKIKNALLNMNCGDAIDLEAPFHTLDRSFLSAYLDSTFLSPQEPVYVHVHVVQTFEKGEFANYLLSAAQQKEMEETEAIELLLMNDTRQAYDKLGDCFIQPLTAGSGDTIGVGSEVTISYTTFLLNGKALDQPTDLQFTFGRPEQVVEGLNYALSMMRSGDEAIVYLPSYLAFGEEGSTGGVVPPKTPVYFRVKVVDVKN